VPEPKVPRREMFFVPISALLSQFDGLKTDCTQRHVIKPSETEQFWSHTNLHTLVNKLSGPDEILNWLLIETLFLFPFGPRSTSWDAAPTLNTPLAAIFNASLCDAYFSSIWKSQEVVPVPKIHMLVSYTIIWDSYLFLLLFQRFLSPSLVSAVYFEHYS